MSSYSLEANEGEKLFRYANQIRFFPSPDLPENEDAPLFGNVLGL
jgi:hypothetical protein